MGCKVSRADKMGWPVLQCGFCVVYVEICGHRSGTTRLYRGLLWSREVVRGGVLQELDIFWRFREAAHMNSGMLASALVCPGVPAPASAAAGLASVPEPDARDLVLGPLLDPKPRFIILPSTVTSAQASLNMSLSMPSVAS